MSTPDIATLGLRVDATQVANADRNLQNFQRSGDRAERSADRLTGTMARMARMAASIGAALAANEIIKQADAWANIQGKLALVTNSSRELASVNDKLFAVAQRTRSELEGTVGLYASLTRSTRELGTSEAQRIRITETINKSMSISGASADSAAGAIRQLGQAFASGTLRGDEYNSVLEASPRLIEAIAAGMGRTTGEMRALAEQGKLSSAAIMQGLLSQSRAIDEEFSRMPTTVGQATTQVQNAILRTIGVFDQQNKLSAGLASTLGSLAANMGTVTAAVGTLVAVGLTKWLSDVATRTMTAIAASRAQAAATLATATAEAQATAQASLLAGARLAEVRASTLAASGNIQLALTTNGLVPAQARAALAADAHSAAMSRLAIAQRAASGASAAAAGALALVGGPIGAVILALGIAATAWTWYKSKQEEANAKAAEDTEKSTGEIIEQLDKQNAKLRERIELSKQAGMEQVAQKGGEAADRLAEINKLLVAEKALVAAGKGDALQVINLQGVYNELAGSIGAVAASTQELATTRSGSDMAAWLDKNTQYLSQSEKIAAALKKAKEELKVDVLPADIEKRIRDSFGKKDVKDMQTAIDAAKDYTKNLREQREELGLTENAVILLNAGRAAAAAPNAKLAAGIMDEARALVVARVATEESTKAKTAYDDAVKAAAESRLQDALAAQAGIDKAREEIETYGMGAAAVTRYGIAKLEAKRDGLMLAGAFGTEVENVQALIDKQKELLALQQDRDALDSMFDTAKVESFGDALRDAFGAAGDSMGRLTNSLQSYLDTQNAADKERAKAKLKYAGDDKKIATEIGKINAKEDKERIGAYADMAGAAKGFFKEHTAGYKILETAERAFRAMEFASQMQSLYTHLFVTTAKASGTAAGQAVETGAVVAGEAQRNIAKVPGVFMSFMSALGPWGMAAAGVAIAAVLGGAFSGGKGSAGMTAADVQKKQGTGGVFGDSDAKSATISKSIELLEENSSMLLPLTEGMLTALRSIDASMGGLTNIVLRTPGVVDGSNFGIQTGQLNIGKPTDLISKAMTGVTNALLGPGLGGAVAGFINNLWGKTKQEITDSGIQFGGSVRDLQGGAGFNQYANVSTTKSSWFGLSKKTTDSTQTGALDPEITQQFGLVFQNLETLLRGAATGVGRDADAVGAAVQNATVDLTKLSLKGLKGQELQDAINAVLSKATDDVAQAALPGFDAYRQIGEGYAQTVIRVASGIEQAGLALELLGVAAIGYSDIANKQGDVGAEIVRQSIVAIEGMSGVGEIMRTLGGTASELAETYGELLLAQEKLALVGIDPGALDRTMIRQAGGLDKLQSGLDDYFDGYFTDAEKLAAKTEAMRVKFAALGQTMPATVEGFRALVESSPALTSKLVLLAGEFSDLMEMVSDTVPVVTLAEKLDDAMRALQTAVDAERDLKTKAHRETMAEYDKAIEKTNSKLSTLQTLSQTLAGAMDRFAPEASAGNRSAAQAALFEALATARAGGPLPDAAKIGKALELLSQDASDQFASARDAQADRYQNAIAVRDLSDITDSQLSIEERNLEQLKRMKELAEASFDAEMARLDNLLETAQMQIDATNGVRVDVQTVTAALGALAGLFGTNSNAAIVGAYGSALGRAPDAAGLGYWQGQATAGMATDKIVELIRTSTEAQDKIEALYSSVLGRTSDAAGKSYWMDQLASGTSLASIEAAMRASDEKRTGGWAPDSMSAPVTYESRSSATTAAAASPAGSDAIVASVDTMRTELKAALAVVASFTQRTANSNEDLKRLEQEKADA